MSYGELIRKAAPLGLDSPEYWQERLALLGYDRVIKPQGFYFLVRARGAVPRQLLIATIRAGEAPYVTAVLARWKMPLTALYSIDLRAEGIYSTSPAVIDLFIKAYDPSLVLESNRGTPIYLDITLGMLPPEERQAYINTIKVSLPVVTFNAIVSVGARYGLLYTGSLPPTIPHLGSLLVETPDVLSTTAYYPKELLKLLDYYAPAGDDEDYVDQLEQNLDIKAGSKYEVLRALVLAWVDPDYREVSISLFPYFVKYPTLIGLVMINPRQGGGDIFIRRLKKIAFILDKENDLEAAITMAGSML